MSVDAAAWQGALAAEHAAIYGYGVVGATTDTPAAAERSLDVHRQRRARCIDVLTAAGETPVSAAPAYDVPRPPGPAAAADRAAELESACWPAYAALCAAGDRRSRDTGAAWLRESTVTAWSWSGDVAELPGLG